MNLYEILKQKLTHMKTMAEEQIKDIDKQLDDYKSFKTESEEKMKEIEKEKKEKNRIYYILVNYKDIIKNEIKDRALIGAVNTIMLDTMFATGLGICSLIVGSFMLKEFIIGVSMITTFSTFMAIKGYFDATKSIRATYKENISKLYAFPTMIAMLDKRIQLELNAAFHHKGEIDALTEEKGVLVSDINKYNQYLDYIDERMPVVSHICRRDPETMNDVYDNDQTVQDCIKLVRIKTGKTEEE